MTTFDVAHFRHQGQDVIIVVVSRQVDSKSDDEKEGLREQMQECAHQAGLAGTVALAWQQGNGRMEYFVPAAWAPFLRSLTSSTLAANINRKLTCG